MAISNIKATTSSTVQPTTQEAVDLKKKLDATLAQLDEVGKYDEYLSMGEKAELAKSRSLLEADLAALDFFLKTGEWVPPTYSTPAGSTLFDLSSIGSGFYLADPSNPSAAPVQPVINNGVIEVENKAVTDPTTGELIPANLWFVPTSSDDPSKNVTDIIGETVGNDVIITIKYEDHTESFTIKNGAIRNDIQIGVNALKSEHSVNIDFSKMVTIDKKTGEKNGVIIIGSKYDDNIIGSSGKDLISGAGGSDNIEGMAGKDEVYGYANADIKNAYGTDALGTDGNDNIFDSYAVNAETSDYIDGGDGMDTVTGGYGNPQYTEYTGVAAHALEEVEGWLTGGAWKTEQVGDEIVMSGGKDSPIDIGIPEGEGWMMSADRDGSDLILTVVKPGEANEPPVSQAIRIKGYFNENAKLNITGEFVDMSKVDVGARGVALNGTDNEGDILIGPKTVFDKYGITVDDLGNSSLDEATIQDRLDYYTKGIKDPSSPWANAKLEGDRIVFNGIDSLNIPPDFSAVAFVKKEGNSYIITVVGVNEDGSTGDSIVLEVRNPGAKFLENLKVGGLTSGKVFNMTGLDSGGVTINGMSENDLIAGFEYGTTFTDEDNSGISIEVNELAGEKLTPTTPKTQGDIIAEINAITEFSGLDEMETKYNKLSADDEDLNKEDILTAIYDRRAALITSEMSDYEGMTDTEKAAIKKEIDKFKGKTDYEEDVEIWNETIAEVDKAATA